MKSVSVAAALTAVLAGQALGAAYVRSTIRDFDRTNTLTQTPYTIMVSSGGYTPQVVVSTNGNALRLTDGGGGESTHAAFNQTCALGSENLFGTAPVVIADFDFLLQPTATQADGMYMALLRSSDVGISGATGVYPTEDPGITTAGGANLAVGFDCYQNGGEPDANHVSLYYGTKVAEVSPPFDFSTTRYHHAKVVTAFRADRSGADVSVIMQENSLGMNSVTSSAPVVVITNAFVAGIQPYDYRLQLGARTGGSTVTCQVDNVYVVNGDSLVASGGDMRGMEGSFTVLGNASFRTDTGGGAFQQWLNLTDNGSGKYGSGWLTTKQSVRYGFTADFEWRVNFLIGGGADGLCFSVQNNNGLLANPGEDGEVANALNVTFDTHNGGGGGAGDEYVFIRDGNTTLLSTNVSGFANFDYDPGRDQFLGRYQVHVDYRDGSLDVFLNDRLIADSLPVSLGALSKGSALDADGKAYVGFSARTGGAMENHDLCNFRWATLRLGPGGLLWDNNGAASPLAQDGAGLWDTNAANWLESDGTNVTWSNAVADAAFIGNGGTGGTIALDPGIVVSNLLFNPVIGSYTLAGNPLTLVEGARINTADDLSVIEADLAGAGFTKTGAGTLTLSGTNSAYSGAITNAGGTLCIGSGGTAGLPGSGALAVKGGTRLLFNRSDSPTMTNAIVTVPPGNAFVGAAAGASAVLGGPISTGGAEFWLTGGGTLILGNASNNFSNSLVISGSSTLQFSDGAQLSGSAGIYCNGAGNRLRYTGPADYSLKNPGSHPWFLYAGTSTVDVAGAGVMTISGNLGDNAGMSSLAKAGSGTLVLTGTNTYSGSTTVNDGVLRIDGTGSLRGGAYAGNIALTASNSALVLSSPVSHTLSGAITGAGTLVHQGSGTLTITGADTHTGILAVSTGTLAVAGENLSACIVGPGATLTVGTPSVSAALTVPGLTIQGGNSLNVFKDGSNSNIRVTGDNAFTLGGLGTSVVHILDYPFEAGSYPVIDYAGAIQGLGTVTGNMALAQMPPHTTATLADNPANSSVDLVFSGQGASIRWTGSTDGNWDVAATTNWVTPVPESPTVYQELGAFADRTLFTDDASLFAVNIASNIIPARVTVSNEVNDYTFNGAGGLNGEFGLVKQGAAALTLANAGNAYRGGTTINGGVLRISDANDRLPVSGAVTLGDVAGATLDLNGLSQTIGSLAGGGLTGGSVALSGGTLIVTQAVTTTFSGTLDGAGSFVKIGAGALTLGGSRSNTNTGTTTLGGTGKLVLAKTGGATAIPGSINFSQEAWNGDAAGIVLAGDEQIADASILTWTTTSQSGATQKDSFFRLNGHAETVGGLNSVGNGGVAVIENRGYGDTNNYGVGTIIVNVGSSSFYSYNGHIRDIDAGAAGSGPIAITKTGTGTQVLSGGNIRYGGATTVTGGKLGFANTTALGAGVINNGATVNFTADASVIGVPGRLSGAGAYEVDGPGTGTQYDNRVVVRGNGADNTGVISVHAGAKLWLDRGVNAIGDSSTINLATGGGFFLYSAIGSDGAGSFQVAETIGGLTGTGSVYGNWENGTVPPVLTVGGGDVSSTFDGTIGPYGTTLNGLQLVKTGAGTLTLNGTNSSSGAVSINQGTLLLNNMNSGTGAVTIASGATLGGGGTVIGPVTAVAGAHIAPGASAGTLTLAGGLTLSDGAILDLELGETSDKIAIPGGTFTGSGVGGITLQITLDALGRDGTFVLIDWNGAAAVGVETDDFQAAMPPGYTGTTKLMIQNNKLILGLYHGSVLMVR